MGLVRSCRTLPIAGNEVPARTPCSDEVWSLTRDACKRSHKLCTLKETKRWPEWMMEAREWRIRLLDKRRDLRGKEGGEFETVQMLLKEASSLLKEAREKVNEQRTTELEEEVSEACRNRQFALLHALRVEYARNGKGSKNVTTSRHAQSGTARTGLEKWRNLLPKAG